MSSIHVWKGMAVAARKGGFAGDESTLPLWDLPKRELVEIALRLTMTEDVSEAVQRVQDERSALKANGII